MGKIKKKYFFKMSSVLGYFKNAIFPIPYLMAMFSLKE